MVFLLAFSLSCYKLTLCSSTTWRQAHLDTNRYEHLVNCVRNTCVKRNHERGLSAGTREHGAMQGRKAHMGEWEHLKRVEGAQLHMEMWAQQRMMEMWLHAGLVHEHSVEKQKCKQMWFFCIKKNIKTPKQRGKKKRLKWKLKRKSCQLRSSNLPPKRIR